MGLFAKLKEVVHDVSDMGHMSKLQDQLNGHIEQLHTDGKCPEAVWSAYETLQEKGEEIKAIKDNTEASKLSLESLKNFLDVLESHEHELPDALKAEVEKFAGMEKHVETISKIFVK